jgi:hypothetical protein
MLSVRTPVRGDLLSFAMAKARDLPTLASMITFRSKAKKIRMSGTQIDGNHLLSDAVFLWPVLWCV